MSRFNSFFANHFASCRLIARARDIHRERDVKLYQIPGEWEVVGVTDGVDAWVAPSSAAPFFHTATGDVGEILRRLKAGEPLGEVPDAPGGRKRARLSLDSETPPDPPPRARLSLDDSAPRKGGRRELLA